MSPFDQDQDEISQLKGKKINLKLKNGNQVKGVLHDTIISPFPDHVPNYLHAVLLIKPLDQDEAINVSWHQIETISEK